MDHIRILRRAFEIVRRYRVLWIFGFLLALTGGRGGGSGSGGAPGGGGSNGGNGGGGFPFPDRFPTPDIPQEVINSAIGIFIAVACAIFLLALVLSVVRYVSQTAAIRLVDHHETTGEQVRFGDGWRLGWSRAAFRMFLVDLMFGLGTFLLVLLLLALAAAPLLLWATGVDTLGIIGTVAAVGLGVLVILLIIVIAVAINLVSEFIHRAIALENLGVFDAIRRGWQIVRRRPGDAIIMGLILFGIGLLFGIALIPVVLLALVAAGLAGGLPGGLIGLLVSLLFSQEAAIITGLAVGIPIFCLMLIIPLTFISGLFEIYTSTVWTLTYREMVALETVTPAPPPPSPEPAALE